MARIMPEQFGGLIGRGIEQEAAGEQREVQERFRVVSGCFLRGWPLAKHMVVAAEAA